MKCQSFRQPSSATYWHIGETTTRLGSVTPPSWIGVKSFAVMRDSRLEPAAHEAAVIGVCRAIARLQGPLFRCDLEAVHVNNEERDRRDGGEICEPCGPGGEQQHI